MKILIVEPYKQPHVDEIDETLQSIQQTVDGYIQVTYPIVAQKENCTRIDFLT